MNKTISAAIVLAVVLVFVLIIIIFGFQAAKATGDIIVVTPMPLP
jgi:hypothetical protein